MSYCDQPPEDDSHKLPFLVHVWICDGPNDDTQSTGCGETVPTFTFL